MKPLETNQRVLTWLCVYPTDDSVGKWKKVAFVICYSTVLIGNIGNLLASVAYFMKYLSIDLEKSLYVVAQMSNYTGAVYVIGATFLLRHDIAAVFDGLKNIYEQYGHYDSFRSLTRANNKSEYIWKIFFKIFIPAFLVGTVATSVASVLLSWLMVGQFDYKFAYLPEKFILPWNQETLFGYVVEMIFFNYSAVTLFISYGILVFLFISICWHHQAFSKMFHNSLRELGDSSNGEEQNDKKLLERLIRFHVSAKEWFLQSAEIYRSYILVQVVLFIACLACCFFELYLMLKHPGFDIVILVTVIFEGLFIIFLFCHFGKLSTESYENMFNSLCECNWHKLPIQLQKHVLLMMANSQQPLYYHGFEIVVLNMETFCTVLRAIGTYCMACRTLTMNE